MVVQGTTFVENRIDDGYSIATSQKRKLWSAVLGAALLALGFGRRRVEPGRVKQYALSPKVPAGSPKNSSRLVQIFVFCTVRSVSIVWFRLLPV